MLTEVETQEVHMRYGFLMEMSDFLSEIQQGGTNLHSPSLPTSRLSALAAVKQPWCQSKGVTSGKGEHAAEVLVG